MGGHFQINNILGKTTALDQIEMKPCISGIWAEVHHKCWGAGQKVQSEKHGDYSLRNRIYFFQFLVSQISKVNYRKVLNVGNGLALLGITTVLCEFVLMYFIKVTFAISISTKSLTIENILLRNFTFNIESLTQQVIFLWQESKSVAMKKYDYVKVNETFPPKKCGAGYLLYDYVKVWRTFPSKKCRPRYKWKFSL